MQLDLSALPLNGSKMKTVSIPDGLVEVTADFLKTQCNHLSKRPNCPRAQQQVAIFKRWRRSLKSNKTITVRKEIQATKTRVIGIRSGAYDSEIILPLL